MTATENVPLSQVPIACEQPPVFAERAIDQPLVGDILFIGRVVSENAQPACEATEHGIGHETFDRVTGRLRFIHPASPPLWCDPAGIRLHR